MGLGGKMIEYFIVEKGDMIHPVILGRKVHFNNLFDVLSYLIGSCFIRYRGAKTRCEAKEAKAYAEKRYKKKFMIVRLKR
jgi:hypothetical protein